MQRKLSGSASAPRLAPEVAAAEGARKCGAAWSVLRLPARASRSSAGDIEHVEQPFGVCEERRRERRREPVVAEGEALLRSQLEAVSTPG
jgi:hypothetical protein